jgi:hypothetical protein
VTDHRTVSRRRSLALALTCGAALWASLSAAPAAGLPMYASRVGATCNTCHVDPNGGGIRNEFGFAYLRNRHATEPEERWSSVTVDPKLNDWITLGLDLRVLYYASHANGGRTLGSSTFFPMQGQVNVAVIPHPHLTLVASHGLVVDEPGVPRGYVAREIYGMVEGLPGSLYARAGRFRIPFGLRQDDHTSYIRDGAYLPYDSQKPDAGIEVGRVGTSLFGQLAFTDGSSPFAERAQTFAAKVGRAADHYQAGLSGFHRYSDALGARFDRWALYAATTQGRLTLLGEAGAGTNRAAGVARNLAAAFAEADYRVLRGLNLRAKFDWVDEDRSVEGGWSRRYTGEADWNPVPFTEVKLSYRYYENALDNIAKEYVALFYFPF